MRISKLYFVLFVFFIITLWGARKKEAVKNNDENKPSQEGLVHNLGLQVNTEDIVTLYRQAYKGVGVNYFSAFYRNLSNGSDTTYKLGADAVGITVSAPTNNPTIDLGNDLIKNEWGMVFKNTKQYNEFYEFPLAHAVTAKDIEKYNFPDPFAPGRWDAAQITIDKYGKTHGIIADLETTLFETAWYLTGLEKFLMDMMLEAEYINPLLDKIQFIHTEYGKK